MKKLTTPLILMSFIVPYGYRIGTASEVKNKPVSKPVPPQNARPKPAAQDSPKLSPLPKVIKPIPQALEVLAPQAKPAESTEDLIWQSISRGNALEFRELLRANELKTSDLIGPWHLVASLDFTQPKSPVALTEVTTKNQQMLEVMGKYAKPYATKEEAAEAIVKLQDIGGSFPALRFSTDGGFSGSNRGAFAGGGYGTTWRNIGGNLIRLEWEGSVQGDGHWEEYPIYGPIWGGGFGWTVNRVWVEGDYERVERSNTAYATRIGRYLFAASGIGSNTWDVYAYNILTPNEEFVDSDLLHQLRIEQFRPVIERLTVKACQDAFKDADTILELNKVTDEDAKSQQFWHDHYNNPNQNKITGKSARILVPQYSYILSKSLSLLQRDTTERIGKVEPVQMSDGSVLLLSVVGKRASLFPFPFIRLLLIKGEINLMLNGEMPIALSKFKREEESIPLRMGNNYTTQFETVELNSYRGTSIEIQPGDRVEIKASGEVSFGPLAGKGGPQGISYETTYNAFDNILHGALLGNIEGEVKDDWFLIGPEMVFTAKTKGRLQLRVNDTQTDDNYQGFKVQIFVFRPTEATP